MIDVVMPQLGESVAEGTVTKWLVREGDYVTRDQTLVEVATDKADTELPSPTNGVVTSIHAATGEVVQVVVYNIVWFAPAIVALAASLTGTIPSGDRLAGAVAWGRAHEDLILAICFAGVGVWLIAKGVAELG